MSVEEEVRETSERFYAAVNRMLSGDAAPMETIWAHNQEVTAMHPVGGRQVGWHEVRESWEQIAALASGGQVQLHDRVIQVVGDMAYEIGVERGQGTLAEEQIAIDHRATNIYRREPGGWKMVHHHTDLAPAMVEVLRRAKEERKGAEVMG